MRRSTLSLCTAVGALVVACDPSAVSTVAPIDAKGVVGGIAFLDRNGNGQLDPPADTVVGGVRIRLVLGPEGGKALVTPVANANGLFPPTSVPVGTYRVEVDRSSLGDSIEVARLDSARITVAAGDSVGIRLQLRFPVLGLSTVRSAAVGKRVTTEGVVLNAWGTYGDSTIHLRDASGSIRLTESAPVGLAVGDSVRVIGVVASRDGHTSLSRPTFFLLGRVRSGAPSPLVTTQEAHSARGGELDAALVRVQATIVRDPIPTPGGDLRIPVTDGSGTLQVLIDRHAPIAAPRPLRAGGQVELTGLLVPAPSPAGEWYLKPRSSEDVRVSYQLTGVTDARGLTGRFVRVRGAALNAGNLFADGMVHVRDSTGAIRVLPTARGLTALGDTLDAFGEITILADGQPAMLGATLVVHDQGVVPPPVALTTLLAASADDGRLDAALVRISNATVDEQVVGPGNSRFRANDGSGPVVLLIGPASGIDPRKLLVAQAVDLVGLLVPAGDRTWLLRPRTPDDVIFR